MKTKHLLCLAPLVLTGCVGYNTALFMTKSNVGLDLDAKPPTAEINISRKEMVAEPSFEGGKTPPVLASFSADVGHNGLSRFLFGVNQTFAGGDSAVTMAKLYDSKTNLADMGKEGETNRARFDSSLQLTNRPASNQKKSWLGRAMFGLAEPGEVRPFIFATDTQFGLKVNWSGAGGPYPDAVKVGFNRKEMAVAPVTLSDANVVRIPSFLATVKNTSTGEPTGETNSLGEKVEVTWMQYFATGEAANHLSRQYAVREAMLERADPKAALLSNFAGAGATQHVQQAEQVVEMTKWATGAEGKLTDTKIALLVKGSALEAQSADITKLAPPDFQNKLNGTWAVYEPKLWENYSKRP